MAILCKETFSICTVLFSWTPAMAADWRMIQSVDVDPTISSISTPQAEIFQQNTFNAALVLHHTKVQAESMQTTNLVNLEITNAHNVQQAFVTHHDIYLEQTSVASGIQAQNAVLYTDIAIPPSVHQTINLGGNIGLEQNGVFGSRQALNYVGTQ